MQRPPLNILSLAEIVAVATKAKIHTKRATPTTPLGQINMEALKAKGTLKAIIIMAVMPDTRTRIITTLIAEGLIRCARDTQTKIISATNRLLLEALRLR